MEVTIPRGPLDIVRRLLLHHRSFPLRLHSVCAAQCTDAACKLLWCCQTFTGAKVGMDWLLVVESARRAVAMRDKKRGETHYVRPGMICVRVQGRRISDIKPNIADAARWVNGFFGRTSGPLVLKFEVELDGTPRMAKVGAPRGPSAAKAKGRRGSILGFGDGDSALHAAAVANGQQVYDVTCGGKGMAVTLGSIGVQLLVAQKRGAPSSTTLQYERILDASTIESDQYRGEVSATTLVITMRDGEKTTLHSPAAQEICLEILIKLEQIDSAKKKEMASSSYGRSEHSSEEDSSDDSSSEDDRFRRVDSDSDSDSDDTDDSEGDDDARGAESGRRAPKSALKTSPRALTSPKALSRTLSFDKTVSYDDGSFDGPQRAPVLEPEPEPEPQSLDGQRQLAEAESIAALRAALATEQKKAQRAETARKEMFEELQKREDSVAILEQLEQENGRLRERLDAAEREADASKNKKERSAEWENRIAGLRERLSIPDSVDEDDLLEAAVDELERRLTAALEEKHRAEIALESGNATVAEKVAAAEKAVAAAEEKAASAAAAAAAAVEKAAAAEQIASTEKEVPAKRAAAPEKVAGNQQGGGSQSQQKERLAEAVPPAAKAGRTTRKSQQGQALTLEDLQQLIAEAKQIGEGGRRPATAQPPWPTIHSFPCTAVRN